MKFLLAFLLLVQVTVVGAAEFTISIREASSEPRDGFVEHADETNQKVYVGPNSGITKEHLTGLTYQESSGEPILEITLTADGGALNQAFTKRMLEKRIAIFINQRLVATPVVKGPSREKFWTVGLSKTEIEQVIVSFKSRDASSQP